MNSTNVIWAHAVGFLAEQLRGTCPFSYGSTIDFGERIVPESEMTAMGSSLTCRVTLQSDREQAAALVWTTHVTDDVR
ncbi:hypothetical protein [Streptomyces sp. NPDC004285]